MATTSRGVGAAVGKLSQVGDCVEITSTGKPSIRLQLVLGTSSGLTVALEVNVPGTDTWIPTNPTDMATQIRQGDQFTPTSDVTGYVVEREGDRMRLRVVSIGGGEAIAHFVEETYSPASGGRPAPARVTAPQATDLASAVALVNALRQALAQVGVIQVTS